MDINIQGEVAQGFEPVKHVFQTLWQDVEVGASFCAFYRGEKVVDLWGGFTDPALSQAWQADTLVNVYSTTKGMGALALALLVDEGKIAYQDPVSKYWPEFGAAGKQAVTVAQCMSHQAGLCGVDTRLEVADLYDWQKMVNLLAAQRPLWPLGEGTGYHAITWGYLPGELIRRITGKSLGQYFHEKVATPLQADFYIGLPATELHRCAAMIGPNRARKQPAIGPTSPVPALFAIAQQNPVISPFRDVSGPAWRQAEIPAANGQANARGIATIYSALAMGGGDIISNAALQAATTLEIESPVDRVLNKPMRWARGFMRNSREEFGPHEQAFGHDGAGGSSGFADPIEQVAIGYAMNQMRADTNAEPRSTLLSKAVYRCIANLS